MKEFIIPIASGIAIGCLIGVIATSMLKINPNPKFNGAATVKAVAVNAVINSSAPDSYESSVLDNTSSLSDSHISSIQESSNSDNSSETSSVKSDFSTVDSSSVLDGSKIGSSKPTGEKTVYLTFDDGPSKLTPKILEILDKYDVKATFFVTGFDKSSAKYIKIAHDKGHTIGLHTYSHNYASVYSSPEAYYKDLNKIANLCKSQIGYIPHYIRFPGGSSNTVSKQYYKGIMTYLSKDVLKKGYQYYDWNSANGDAMGGKPTANELYKNAVSSVGNTDIVMLCHDSADKQNTVKSLPKIIEYYKSKDYTFKAIDDKTYTAHHRTNN
ncbi:MAG: polysaccharide deacetylase family protein [Oscillospiraceae bacterium]